MAASVNAKQLIYLQNGPRQGVYCRPTVPVNVLFSEAQSRTLPYPPHPPAPQATGRIRWRVSQFRNPEHYYRLRERTEDPSSDSIPAIQGHTLNRPPPSSTASSSSFSSTNSREQKPQSRVPATKSGPSAHPSTGSFNPVLRNSRLSRSTSKLTTEGVQKSESRSGPKFSLLACAATIQSRPLQRSAVIKKLVIPAESFPYPDPAKHSDNEAFDIRLTELAKLERDTVKLEELRARLRSVAVPQVASSQSSVVRSARPSSAKSSQVQIPTRAVGRRTSTPIQERAPIQCATSSLASRRLSAPPTAGSKVTTPGTQQATHHRQASSPETATKETSHSPSQSLSPLHKSSNQGNLVFCRQAEETCYLNVQGTVIKQGNGEIRDVTDMSEWKVTGHLNNQPIQVTLSKGIEQNPNAVNRQRKSSSSDDCSSTTRPGSATKKDNISTPKLAAAVEIGDETTITSPSSIEHGLPSSPTDFLTHNNTPCEGCGSVSPTNGPVTPAETSTDEWLRQQSTVTIGSGASKPAPQAAMSASTSARQATPPSDVSSTSTCSVASEQAERPGSARKPSRTKPSSARSKTRRRRKSSPMKKT